MLSRGIEALTLLCQVSTNKTHARGPVGLEGLVIYKYTARGNGHAASDFGSGKKQYMHKTIAPEDYKVYGIGSVYPGSGLEKQQFTSYPPSHHFSNTKDKKQWKAQCVINKHIIGIII